MKALYKPALGTFNFICIILAGYMTLKQIQIYLENADTSAISFQKFSQGSITMYPTYTICLEDSGRGDMYSYTKENVLEEDANRLGGTPKFHVKVVDHKFLIVPGERPYNASMHGGGEAQGELITHGGNNFLGSLTNNLEHDENLPGFTTEQGHYLGIPGETWGIMPGSHDGFGPPNSLLGGSPPLLGGPPPLLGGMYNPNDYDSTGTMDENSGSDGNFGPPNLLLGGPPPLLGGSYSPNDYDSGPPLLGMPFGTEYFGYDESSSDPPTNPVVHQSEPGSGFSLLDITTPPNFENPFNRNHTTISSSNFYGNQSENTMLNGSGIDSISNEFSNMSMNGSFVGNDAGNDLQTNGSENLLGSSLPRFRRRVPYQSSETIHSKKLFFRNHLKRNKMLSELNMNHKKSRYKRNLDVRTCEIGTHQMYPEGFQMRYDLPLIKWEKHGKTYGILPRHFKELLAGIYSEFKWQPPEGNWIPECKDIKYTLDDFSSFVFDDNVIDIQKFVLDYYTRTSTGSLFGWINDTYVAAETECILRTILGDTVCGTQDSFLNHLQQRTSIAYPFKKVFQDPTKLCYSPEQLPDVHKKSDHLTFNLTDLKANFNMFENWNMPALTIHIHMQGQFLRSIGKELSSLTPGDLVRYCPEMLGSYSSDCFGTRLTFDISQVTLLKSRHDADKQCENDLKDEDEKIMKTILEDDEVRCVPMFWMGLSNYSSRYPKCTTDSQYRRIADLTAGTQSKIRDKIVPPCQEMIIVTNVQRVKGRIRKNKDLYLDFQLRHVNDRYQVITNTRGFSVESCWSGIGGFIGIFVGVSLMQLPEIFLAFYTFLCKRKNTSEEKEKKGSKFKV